MTTRLSRLRLLLLSAALGALVAGCGGGSGSGGSASADSNTVAPTGSVGLILTDGPTDRFDKVLITITRIELLGDDDNDADDRGGRAVVFEGSRTVDLLAVSAVGDLFAVEDVPAGDYSKIRLRISDMQLVDTDVDPNEVVHPKLPPKIDLNPRGTFTVPEGETLLLEVDIDAEKSLHVVETGNGGFRFRPVVFVDIKDGIVSSRLTRVFGTVGAVGDGVFELCPQRLVSATDHDDNTAADDDFRGGRCLDVRVDDRTGIFDGNADPQAFAAVTPGAELTAIGFFRRSDDFAVETMSSHDLDGGDHRDDDLFDEDLFLNAAVLELGPRDALLRIPGSVQGAVDVDQRFPFLPEPGRGIDSGQLPVQLQPGTRIFSRAGVELAASDLTAGQQANVDGALALSDVDPDILKAALVVLDLTAALESRRGGVLQTVDAGAGTLVLTVDEPPEATPGDTTVSVNEPDTRIFRIVEGPEGATSERLTLAELAALVSSTPELRADVFGTVQPDGSIDADTVLVFDL